MDSSLSLKSIQSKHCALVSRAATCSVSIPNECWFNSQLLNFQFLSLLMCLGRQWKMAQELELLAPTWEAWNKASGSRLQPDAATSSDRASSRNTTRKVTRQRCISLHTGPARKLSWLLRCTKPQTEDSRPQAGAFVF